MKPPNQAPLSADTARATPPKPRLYRPDSPDAKIQEAFVFEGGALTVKTQGYGAQIGSGWLSFRQDELQPEYGEDGKDYWIANLDASEMLALRDKLNELWPSADTARAGATEQGLSEREAIARIIETDPWVWKHSTPVSRPIREVALAKAGQIIARRSTPADTARAGELELISDARRVLKGYRLRSLNFNPPVGTEGNLVDLIRRLTAALSAAPTPTQEGADDNAGAGDTGGRG